MKNDEEGARWRLQSNEETRTIWNIRRSLFRHVCVNLRTVMAQICCKVFFVRPKLNWKEIERIYADLRGREVWAVRGAATLHRAASESR